MLCTENHPECAENAEKPDFCKNTNKCYGSDDLNVFCNTKPNCNPFSREKRIPAMQNEWHHSLLFHAGYKSKLNAKRILIVYKDENTACVYPW